MHGRVAGWLHRSMEDVMEDVMEDIHGSGARRAGRQAVRRSASGRMGGKWASLTMKQTSNHGHLSTTCATERISLMVTISLDSPPT